MPLSLHPFPSSSSLFLPLHLYFLPTSVRLCDEVLQTDGNFMYCTSAVGLFCCPHSNFCHHPSSALRCTLPTSFFFCSFLHFLPTGHKPACDIIHSFHGQAFKLLHPYCTGSVRTSVSFVALSNGPVAPTKE